MSKIEGPRYSQVPTKEEITPASVDTKKAFLSTISTGVKQLGLPETRNIILSSEAHTYILYLFAAGIHKDGTIATVKIKDRNLPEEEAHNEQPTTVYKIKMTLDTEELVVEKDIEPPGHNPLLFSPYSGEATRALTDLRKQFNVPPDVDNNRLLVLYHEFIADETKTKRDKMRKWMKVSEAELADVTADLATAGKPQSIVHARRRTNHFRQRRSQPAFTERHKQKLITFFSKM